MGFTLGLSPRAVFRCAFAHLVICLSLLPTSCATAKRDSETPPGPASLAEMANLRSQLAGWAETKGAAATRVKRGWDGQLDDGDALLFNAILCSTGDETACSVVAASQGPDGRFWRSPDLVGQEKENSFSRDMGIGVVLWAAVKGDAAKPALEAWRAYVKKNGKMCPQASDNRCLVTPSFAAYFNYVAEKVGFSKLPFGIVRGEDVAVSVPALAGPETPFLFRMWQTLEPTTPRGFALHLLAVQMHTVQHLGVWDDTLQAVANRLVKREPKNAYYLWLARGVDETVANLWLELVPRQKPESTREWAWERKDEDLAYLKSCGWDFIAVADLVLKP